jgi:glucose 1-dehydrogenase
MSAIPRRALITGSDRGIGLAIARSFARNRIEVILHGRDPSPLLEEVAAQIRHETATAVRTVAADLVDMAAASALFDNVGGVDILINNAGFEVMAPLETQPLDDWQAIMAVNIYAPILLSQRFAQARIAAGSGGVIVNISSIHQNIPRKGFAAYSIAKAGLDMLTKSAALEWAEHGIRVLTVAPGAIETDINRTAIEALGRDRFNRWIPTGRIGTTDDVAELVSFLVSDQAGYMTGTCVTLDGGYSQALVQYDPRERT